jgi:hypothetical protein
MTPNANTSVAGVQGLPSSCSGAHHGMEAPYESGRAQELCVSRQGKAWRGITTLANLQKLKYERANDA